MSIAEQSALRVDYVMRPVGNITLHRFSLPAAYERARAQNLFDSSLLFVALAIIVAVQSRSLGAAVVFGGWGALQLIAVFRFKRLYWQRVAAAVPLAKRLSIVVDDRGLHETDQGVESFAPWTAVLGYRIFTETLLISLANRQWALIPRATLSDGSGSLEELVDRLRQRDIMELPEPTSSSVWRVPLR
jgi:hypothetical protein